MKKPSTKIIASLLSFVFMFAGVFAIAVNAEDSTSYKVCVKDHFSKLHGSYKVPPNMEGTCTFVAMSMLLSFYDSYWNDRFVTPVDETDTSNNLEWQKGFYSSSRDKLYSPFNSNAEEMAWNNYSGNIYDFVEENKNTYLQSYLIDMCNELPIIDEFGVLDYQVQDLLERYLYVKRGFTTEEITVNIQYEREIGQEELISIMKEQINAGNPVIYFGLSIDILPEEVDSSDVMLDGHAMIAYDVFIDDQGRDDIVLHMGWNGDNDDQTVRTTSFEFLNSIIWLEINEEVLPHECTDAYEDIVTGEDLCACEVYYYTHPGHSVHPYQNCKYHSSESHYYICGCGYTSSLESHSLTYSYYSPIQHYKCCQKCGYAGPESHKYNKVCPSDSSAGHYLECACGAISSTTENHYSSKCTIKNSDLHYVYCKCGYLIGTDTHTMVIKGGFLSVSVCAYCGYTRDNNSSGIIIKGIEDEPVTE